MTREKVNEWERRRLCFVSFLSSSRFCAVVSCLVCTHTVHRLSTRHTFLARNPAHHCIRLLLLSDPPLSPPTRLLSAPAPCPPIHPPPLSRSTWEPAPRGRATPSARGGSRRCGPAPAGAPGRCGRPCPSRSRAPPSAPRAAASVELKREGTGRSVQLPGGAWHLFLTESTITPTWTSFDCLTVWSWWRWAATAPSAAAPPRPARASSLFCSSGLPAASDMRLRRCGFGVVCDLLCVSRSKSTNHTLDRPVARLLASNNPKKPSQRKAPPCRVESLNFSSSAWLPFFLGPEHFNTCQQMGRRQISGSLCFGAADSPRRTMPKGPAATPQPPSELLTPRWVFGVLAAAFTINRSTQRRLDSMRGRRVVGVWLSDRLRTSNDDQAASREKAVVCVSPGFCPSCAAFFPRSRGPGADAPTRRMPCLRSRGPPAGGIRALRRGQNAFDRACDWGRRGRMMLFDAAAWRVTRFPRSRPQRTQKASCDRESTHQRAHCYSRPHSSACDKEAFPACFGIAFAILLLRQHTTS